MNEPPITRGIEKWTGEVVEIILYESSEVHAGKVRAAKNGALILVPISGKRQPMMIDFEDINEIRAVELPQDVMPWPTVENVRIHMYKFHAWITQHAPAVDLLDVHKALHQIEDNQDDGKFGHTHPTS